MGFFSKLFQFPESFYAETHQNLLKIARFKTDVQNGYLREHCEFSFPDGRSISAGTFSMPSVAELRDCVSKRVEGYEAPCESFVVRNIVGEARSMHGNPEFKGAVVQAASQFNFLEFSSSSVTPENGIQGYIHDGTQGPACAIACAAGTAYRNYLVPVPFDTTATTSSGRGQRRNSQLNGLERVETYLESHLNQVPWTVKNGYIDSTAAKLKDLNQLLKENETIRDEIIARLCICVQEDTAITDILGDEDEQQVLVSQTYNSAISIGYSYLPASVWAPIAKTVLDATYEATLLQGLLKTMEAHKSGKAEKPVILLTKVGGGVFANKDAWILAAIARAVARVKEYGVGMDVRIVHFGRVNKDYRVLEDLTN